MNRENRRRQTRKKQEKKQRARARAQTQRLRNKARSALRNEKAVARNLETTEPSEANEVFAEGLSAYREFHGEMKADLIADKIYDFYKQAPKNRFYVRLYGNRPMHTFEFLRRANEGYLLNFDILYKGNRPEEDFYFSFYEDEYDYDDEIHRVLYHTIAEQHAPFLYFAVLFHDELTAYEQKLLYDKWDYHIESPIWETPLEFLENFSPRFKKLFEKEMDRYAVYRQKVRSLPEKAITSFLERGEEASGRPLPENVEARIRSMISTRPFARNYSGVTHNFSRINTSLFN